MNENKEFEHEIDPDLLAEIEEWEKRFKGDSAASTASLRLI